MSFISRLKSSTADTGSKRIMIAVGAIIVGAVAWSVLSTPEPVANRSSVANLPDTPTVQGQGQVTPAMETALSTADGRRIDAARSTGGTAMPTVRGTPQQQRLPELTLDPVPEPPAPIERPVVQVPQIVQQPLTQAVPIVQQPQQVRSVADTTNLQDYMLKMKRGYAVAEVVTLSTGELPTVQAEQTAPAVEAAGQGQQQPESRIKLPLSGTILYAQMVSRANSDAPGPVLAKILQGEYEGATLIGSFQTVRNALVIEFDKMTVKTTRSGEEINETVAIETVAVDTRYIGTALATKVDRHLFQKLAIGFTASFAEGFGRALSSSGRTRIVSDRGTVIETGRELDTEEQLYAAGGQAIAETGNILMDEFGRRPTTVIVESGTPVGILFL